MITPCIFWQKCCIEIFFCIMWSPLISTLNLLFHHTLTESHGRFFLKSTINVSEVWLLHYSNILEWEQKCSTLSLQSCPLLSKKSWVLGQRNAWSQRMTRGGLRSRQPGQTGVVHSPLTIQPPSRDSPPLSGNHLKSHQLISLLWRCEVQSPGFTTRLTNMVRARQENPQYSRFGNLPLVRLSRYCYSQILEQDLTKF